MAGSGYAHERAGCSRSRSGRANISGLSSIPLNDTSAAEDFVSVLADVVGKIDLLEEKSGVLKKALRGADCAAVSWRCSCSSGW